MEQGISQTSVDFLVPSVSRVPLIPRNGTEQNKVLDFQADKKVDGGDGGDGGDGDWGR